MKQQLPPGPKGKFFVGSLEEFQRNPLLFFRNLLEDYGEVAYFRFGPFQKVFLVSDPKLIKEVLVTKQRYFVKSRDLTMLKPIIGEGLLTSEKDHHLKQRRLIQPSFQQKHIGQYAQDMIDTTKAYLDRWEDGEERMITEDMMNITLGIISKTMFNMEFTKGYDIIGTPIENVMKLAIKRMRSILPSPLWIPTKTNRQYKKAIKELDSVLYSIIDQRRQSKVTSDDLLGVLMKARDENNRVGMTDKQLRDELMTIFLAGHETTANALSWTLYLLSQHQRVQKKLHKEVDRVIGNGELKPEHYKKLTYTQNIIHESLRLYPPAYMIGRQVDEDVPLGDYLLKKGDMVFISQYVMHRREDYFTHPDEFIPERFENSPPDSLPPYTYFPFGGGPRICIGNHFALMEAVLVLACIAQHYKVKLAPNHPEVKPQPLITLRPKGELRMVVEKRNIND
ncbi:cytochrome P450 [Evansella vedderi]|uniref:Cytochrome P450 n=1 Tax=Evansella vedderi TaxID=38282 RepID=A0ABT9ZX30_9BACI|nr:cytochrome P450 [Evansella vedderi]MDQ0255297.1 cytochrome P450 [Evansella vedderi]